MNQHSLNNIKITMAPMDWSRVKREFKWFEPIEVITTQPLETLKNRIHCFELGSMEIINQKIKISFALDFSAN